MIQKTPNSITQYISQFSPETQKILNKVRDTIQKSAPDAIETISYGMPAFKLNNKILIYFAAAKKHLGIYPTTIPIIEFAKELAKHKTSKGAIQFPYSQPIPYDLIAKITRFRVKQLSA